jgi:tetratricopeptide (TPR) repeat protein
VLANLYLSAHEDEKCEEQLKKIIALEPASLAHRYELARFYQHAGKMDAAQGVLEEAVRVVPGKSDAKLALAEFLANQRSREQGEKTLRAFVAADPKDDQLRLGLAVLLQRSGAVPEALEAYKEVVTRDSRSSAALTARDRMAALEIGRGNTAAAAPLVAAVLEQSPRDTDALLMRADLALRAGKPQAAIADLRAVLRDQPNAAQVQYALAQAYVQNGEKSLAEETLRTTIQGTPSSVAPRLELARLLTQDGHLGDAVALLEESVRQLPADGEIRQALVRAYLAKGDLAAARTAAEDLKTLQPNAASGPYLAGLVAERENHVDVARREFERALQLQPGATEALVGLTKLELAHGQGGAAVARLRAIVKSDPKDAFAQNLLGEALIATGAYGEAVALLTQTVQLAPKWSLPYHNLALAHRDDRNVAAAEQAYQAGLKEMPFDPVLTADLADLYEQRGDVDAAIALYEGLNARDPRLALARNNLAMLLVTYRGDHASLDRARALTEDFATSDSGALLDTHGWVRLKLGEVNDALAVLTRAADRAPDSRVIHYHLAMAELKAGERDKARANLETALAGSARFSGSDDARAALNSLAGSRS